MQPKTHRPPTSCNLLASRRWPRMRILKDVAQLNEHLIAVLSVLAQMRGPTSLAVIGDNADLWGSLDAPSRRRAALFPVLLLDLHFQDATWWGRIVDGAGAPPADAGCAGARAEQWQPEFTRESLMLAWPAAREDRAAAALLFGMSKPVADLVGSLSPQQLDHVSLHHSHEMRLRWAHTPQFWRRLLLASKVDDVAALKDVYLLGLQLLGGEMIRPLGEVASDMPRRIGYQHRWVAQQGA